MKTVSMSTFFFMCSALAASGQSLTDISKFAEEICGDIPSGTYTRTEITGKVGANLGALAKILNVDAGADASRLQQIYEGIPFDNLPSQIPTESMCKSELAKTILERKEARANTCRHPDFGQASWGRSEDYTNSSGRMRGGHDQNWWCNQVAAQFMASRSIGSQSTWTRLGSHEESNKDWKGKATYKYHCTIRVRWEPVYNERADASRCGVSYF